MSAPEQKPNQADQRVQKILDQIAELKLEMKKYEPPTATKETPSAKEEDPYEHVHACPTCKAKLEKEFAEKTAPLEKKIRELSSKLPWKCSTEGCDEYFTEEEAKNLFDCPKCHNRKPIRQK